MAHEELKARSRAVWTSGEYRQTGRRLAPVSEILLDALGVQPGIRLLDVAAGDGNCAIAAARRGAEVLATDFSPVMIERGRRRAADAGLDIAWEEADAADLPLPDATFDAVTSVFGAIFAPEQERVAAELVRVTRPGGRVGMTAWVRDGLTARVQQLSREVLPPAGSEPPPDPYRWGDGDHVAGMFRSVGCADVTVRSHTLTWSFPSWDAWREEARLHGMAVVTRDLVGEAAFEDLLDRQRDVLAEEAHTTPDGIAFDSGYLVIVVTTADEHGAT